MNGWAQLGLAIISVGAVVAMSVAVLVGTFKKTMGDVQDRLDVKQNNLNDSLNDEIASVRRQMADAEERHDKEITELRRENEDLKRVLEVLKTASDQSTAESVVELLTAVWSPEVFAKAFADELDRRT